MSSPNFDGLRVLALESRHGKELAKLIASYGGQPTVAPALREVRSILASHKPFPQDLLAVNFGGDQEEMGDLRRRREENNIHVAVSEAFRGLPQRSSGF